MTGKIGQKEVEIRLGSKNADLDYEFRPSLRISHFLQKKYPFTLLGSSVGSPPHSLLKWRWKWGEGRGGRDPLSWYRPRVEVGSVFNVLLLLLFAPFYFDFLLRFREVFLLESGGGGRKMATGRGCFGFAISCPFSYFRFLGNAACVQATTALITMAAADS